MAPSKTITVRLKCSTIGQSHQTRRVVQALGLRRLGQSNELKDNNCIRGMINKVRHLVAYTIND